MQNNGFQEIEPVSIPVLYLAVYIQGDDKILN